MISCYGSEFVVLLTEVERLLDPKLAPGSVSEVRTRQLLSNRGARAVWLQSLRRDETKTGVSVTTRLRKERQRHISVGYRQKTREVARKWVQKPTAAEWLGFFVFFCFVLFLFSHRVTGFTSRRFVDCRL